MRWPSVLVALALVLGVLYYISWIPRTDANARRASARAEFLKLGLALELYHRRFQTYPPDTGYGLDMERSPGTYDPGSLWRYLMKPVRDPETGKKVGPFIDEWNPKQLESYNDARAGPSYYLTDPWGGPYGFVAERKRLVHNKSSFDLFSPGPDGVTARDRHGTKPNLAYDGLDNDGNGIADDAAELGPDASRNGDVGDDVNTWSPRGSAVQPHPRRIRRGQVPGDGP